MNGFVDCAHHTNYTDCLEGAACLSLTLERIAAARRSGVHPYCITIDETARDYPPRLYGHAAYTVVDNVRDPPLKVSDIYRKLTT